MELTNARREEIKIEVVYIFEEYDIKCIPISGFELATKMGIRLVPYSTLSSKRMQKAVETDPDGFFVGEGLKEYIFYNDAKSYERINWTILHEIGHIALGHIFGTPLEEEEARFFAKYAIAPPPLIHRLGADSPEDVQYHFDVSYEVGFYSYAYYKKWLIYGDKKYTAYEQRLLLLFDGIA